MAVKSIYPGTNFWSPAWTNRLIKPDKYNQINLPKNLHHFDLSCDISCDYMITFDNHVTKSIV